MNRWWLAGGAAAAVIAACALAIGQEAPKPGAGAAPEAIRVKASPVRLLPKLPWKEQVGDFVFVGGLNLTSRDTDRLHGLSDLNITSQGALTAEGDEGELFTARLVLGKDGRLTGLSQTTLRRLTGPDGKTLTGKSESDAEGLAIWPNGDLMISFERDHRIWRYPAGGGPPVPMPIPADPKMVGNEGMEGLALAPAQGADAYWVGVENGDIFLCRAGAGCEAQTALPRPPDSFRLAGLTETAGGQLAVLFEAFSPISGSHLRLTLIDAPASAQPVAVDVLALDPPMTTDNFEGVASVRRPDGGDRFYLIVDDNFQAAERTLLMAFDRLPRKGKTK